jgi:hypothetical protein
VCVSNIDLSEYLQQDAASAGLTPMERFLQAESGFSERCGMPANASLVIDREG